MSNQQHPAAEPTPAIPSLGLFALHGQVALVTGGTRGNLFFQQPKALQPSEGGHRADTELFPGIGAACAIALAQAGASICLLQRDVSKRETLTAIKEHIASVTATGPGLDPVWTVARDD